MYTCIDNALFSELLLQVPLHQKSLVLETFGLVGHKASQQASWLIHLAATEKQLDRVSDKKHAFCKKIHIKQQSPMQKALKTPVKCLFIRI